MYTNSISSYKLYVLRFFFAKRGVIKKLKCSAVQICIHHTEEIIFKISRCGNAKDSYFKQFVLEKNILKVK